MWWTGSARRPRSTLRKHHVTFTLWTRPILSRIIFCPVFYFVEIEYSRLCLRLTRVLLFISFIYNVAFSFLILRKHLLSIMVLRERCFVVFVTFWVGFLMGLTNPFQDHCRWHAHQSDWFKPMKGTHLALVSHPFRGTERKGRPTANGGQVPFPTSYLL